MMLAEICKGCKDRWESKGVAPKTLVPAPRHTPNKGLVVLLCPWCDGNALAQAKATEARGDLPAE